MKSLTSEQNVRYHRYAACLSVFLLICTFILPATFAFEGEGGGEQGGGDNGGGSEESAPQQSAAATEGFSANGGRRGHETARLTTIARFTARTLYPSVLETDSNRPDALTKDERAYLCSMSRIRLKYGATIQEWFIEYLAELIHRPVSQVSTDIQSEFICNGR